MEFSVWLRAETRLLPSQTCGVKVTEELWVGLKHAAESVRMFSHTNVSVITFSYKLIKVIHFQFSSHIWFNVTLVGQRLQVSAALNTESLIIFAHIKLTARVFQLNKVFTTLTNLYHLISYKLNWQYSRCWLLFIRILRGEILMVITILFFIYSYIDCLWNTCGPAVRRSTRSLLIWNWSYCPASYSATLHQQLQGPLSSTSMSAVTTLSQFFYSQLKTRSY